MQRPRGRRKETRNDDEGKRRRVGKEGKRENEEKDKRKGEAEWMTKGN